MTDLHNNESMLDMYIFETTQNIEQLENSILSCEKTNCFTKEAINEIFRIMHTIKGSSAMMLFNNISALAHSVEDLFFFLREQKSQNIDCKTLSDLILEGVDFIKVELQKVKNRDDVDSDPSSLISSINVFLDLLKQQSPSEIEAKTTSSYEKQQYYIAPDKLNHIPNSNAFKATIFFEDNCEMENIRAYSIIHNVKEFTQEVFHIPKDIIDNDDSVHTIREHGFTVYVKTYKVYEEMYELLIQTLFLKDLKLEQLNNDEEFKQFIRPEDVSKEETLIKEREVKDQIERETISSGTQSIISVNVNKLDKLMDLVGEMVIAEAMVTQNPDIKGLELENFQKSASQLRKITSELQDLVMAIRMVPLSSTFQKMQRIVRDMSKKLYKDIQLELIGEETEVDKNIIEHISDPLMHLVRNSIDHGIEALEDRLAVGKPKTGTITLEAKNVGSDVLLIIKDDGKGLNKDRILRKARENGLLNRMESEMTDKEVYNLIFLPGFSTKDAVSEFSGRGVGMDVVSKNIVAVGGSVAVDSLEGAGTTVTIKIPLTLAIIDGMSVRVGSSCYTIPTTSIKESFRPRAEDVITDPDGNEMIMVRGQCHPIIRLHKVYKVKTAITDFTEGILIMVQQDNSEFCLFADELVGQQQVVVKALPNYIKNMRKIGGLTGCTLLGDGSISLILDVGGINRIG